ncbi:MAG: MarR family winged helix-turn-helix transcriptional regulator [Anaerolineae bacterium]|nr:MarR family winged helix-turn-helix transcriptional regulator [Anaerolineae bacterium]
MEKILLEFIATLDHSLKKKQSDGFSQLTVSQFQYIDAIAALDSPTMSDVAARLGFSKASATTAIDKLVALGFVSKTQSEMDKRVFHVGLTEAGGQLVQAKFQTLKEYGDFIAAALTADEARQFEAILTKLVQVFKG